MNIKPIHTNEEYHESLAAAALLMDALMGTAEGDQLEVLTTLIEAYELRHYSVPLPDDPIEAIQFFVEQRGISKEELAAILGVDSANDILSRHYPLTIEMIRNLHYHLAIPAEILIQSYPLQRAA
ncbi:MAG: transcriptional regulator [Chlorobi bacterium]|jgi:HTH-type transcriptional regulator/antitoxin HigA|nr:transcriptional regulator [Chlorobiota bacterium]